ncbi:ABC transporter substrate-binding protein [Bradyrhizobium sp.]|uniref:ABC transporter substrate-binding protein n=1 Tax=Bradyrhizobium sp. TaxID=376 RepID=UPI002D2456A9|nr:ABC transporter substrate-binding protein [Bradyrhizobium sp.]HZR74577.1 ABC transporter substrate-binding protein [Bradyrhizobium sp.]
MRPAFWRAATMSAVAVIASAGIALAANQNDPGVTDKTIKIGNIMPYSGPVSAYGVIGRIEAAYFKKINDEGGINGHKIDFVSYDDAYSPPKTVEQARKLVEDDQVLLIFNSLGTPTNTAIRPYLNEKKVPQLFVATGATKWNDPKKFPWTMGWQPNYQIEAGIYAKYILEHKPNAKIAVLYQNDDYGKDYLKGLTDGLGAKAKSMIVAEKGYDTSEPTVDSQMVTLAASEADVFVDITTPKFAAQSIKKANELNWHPMFFLNNVSASVGSVLKPAGFDASQGIISANYLKDATSPQWKNDADVKEWNTFMDKYAADYNKSDAFTVYGYAVARTMVQVLKQCGNDFTRANVMKQAANLKDFDPGLLLPGIKVNTSATNFAPIRQLQLMQFKGESWQLFGPVMSGEAGGEQG